MDSIAIVAGVLGCPRCGGALAAPGGARCAHMVASPEGIVDLTLEDSRTALDDIDYDAVYDVDPERGRGYFTHLRAQLGSLAERRFDTIVELGAGTGYMSVPLLEAFGFERALITDISPRMLAVCRAKIATTLAPERRRRIAFAALDGNHIHARADSVDLVFGHGVLHHVFDYEPLLATIAGMLREDGVAVFVEPVLRFHQALLVLLGRVVEELRGGLDLGADTTRVLAFLQHLVAGERFRGDRDFLARMEDKHLFVREELHAVACAAGFVAVDSVPAYRGETFTWKMRGYCAELGLGSEATGTLLERVAVAQHELAPLLERECWSSADLHVLRCARTPGGLAPACFAWTRPDTAAELRALAPVDTRALACWIDALRPLPDGRCELVGWIAASVPVRHVRLAGDDGATATGQVHEARIDVLRHLGSQPRIPALAALCSGFRLGPLTLAWRARVTLEVHCIDGAITTVEVALPRPAS